MRLTNETIEKIKAIAQTAHKGQVDKAGVDYFEGHLSAVASLVDYTTSEEEYSKMVATAYLHDILEDTNETPEGLVVKLLDIEIDYRTAVQIVDAVILLTKQPYDRYEDYLKRLSKNLIAKHVKLADLAHNSDLTRLKEVTQADLDRACKYQRARETIYC